MTRKWIGGMMAGKGGIGCRGDIEVKKNKTSEHLINRRRILRLGLYSGLAATLPSVLWLGACGKKANTKKPSIILITIDTLRADHLGCYGYHKDTSPGIDAFSEDAMLFENCFSHAPETLCSFASILSGYLPHETKILENPVLSSEVTTLPEMLKRVGYTSAAVVSNYVLRTQNNFGKGFMIYDDTMNERELIRKWPERIAENTTNRAIELLQQLRRDEFFLWIHYQDPHGPYAPPKHFADLFVDPEQEPLMLKLSGSLSGLGGIPSHQQLGENRDYHYYVSQYDGEIRYLDEQFERLTMALKELGLYEDALIIFTSDHGEGMGEKKYFFAHIDYIHNGLIHVPLIIKHGSDLSGKRRDYVQHLDIVPSVLKFLGLKPDSRLRGTDLLAPRKVKKEIFSEMRSREDKRDYKMSLIYDGFKLIFSSLTQQHQLFNMATDPFEKNNLVEDALYQGRHMDLKKRLWRVWEEDYLDIPTSKALRLTDDQIEKLKSLGYAR